MKAVGGTGREQRSARADVQTEGWNMADAMRRLMAGQPDRASE